MSFCFDHSERFGNHELHELDGIRSTATSYASFNYCLYFRCGNTWWVC